MREVGRRHATLAVERTTQSHYARTHLGFLDQILHEGSEAGEIGGNRRNAHLKELRHQTCVIRLLKII